MIVRRANIADVYTVVELGRRLHAETGRKISFHEASAEQTALRFIHSSASEILVVTENEQGPAVGFSVALLHPCLFNFKVNQAVLALWYVDPVYRGKGIGHEMMERLQLWAAENGAFDMIAGSAVNGKTDGILSGMGFSRHETAFMKEL